MTRLRPPLSVALLLLAALPATAQLEPWSVPFAHPLRLSSLPFDPGQCQEAVPGTWRLNGSVGYFNLWSGSWHTATIHQELGLVGQPMTPAELRILEARHPGDTIYRFDVEGVAGELNITRGLQRGLSITLSLPFLEIGRPHWDAISHDVHGALDWGQGSREIFARSGTLLYAWSPRQQRALEAWDELEGSGVGDLTVSLAGPLGGWAGAAHRWAVVLQAPTGRRGTLQGSGGWDGGVRWMATWNRTAAIWRLAAGYSHLDPGGDLLGVERADTWHLSGEMHRRWGARGSWLVATRWETSPLADFTGGEVGSSTFFFTFGARRQLGDGSWVAVALGENLVPRGIAPDFTLSVQIGSTLPSSSP